MAAHKRGLRYAAAIMGAVVLVMWQRPGPKGVVLVAVLVLVSVGVIEVVGRALPARPGSGSDGGQPRLFSG